MPDRLASQTAYLLGTQRMETRKYPVSHIALGLKKKNIFNAKGQRTLSWFGKRKSNNVSQHVEEHLLNVQRITLGEKSVDWQQQRNTRCQSQIRTGN